VFGKILGTESDYYIVETDNNADEEAAAAEEEGFDVDQEGKGVGANMYAYFVASNAYSAWTRLPDVSPKDIEASRLIKVLLTGDLDRDIITNPFFFGKERNYLRAQIARISHGTSLLARPMWKLDPDNERLVVAEEGPEDGGELPLPSTT